jgi:hypothetical protein
VSESESKEDRKGMESRSDATTREGRREDLQARQERRESNSNSNKHTQVQ